jgi:hypothetical protein
MVVPRTAKFVALDKMLAQVVILILLELLDLLFSAPPVKFGAGEIWRK